MTNQDYAKDKMSFVPSPSAAILLWMCAKQPAVKTPGKPGRPEVVDYDADRVELSWTLSADTETEIESYDIQMRIKGGEWEQV